MPEIPKVQTGMIQHVNASSPMSSPGTLQHYDSGAAQNFMTAQRAFDRGITALAAFQKEAEETENRLSATEAKNLYMQMNNDLVSRMKENPGSFDKFEEWSNAMDEEFDKKFKPFLDRMTPEFRKQFEADFAGVRIEGRSRRIDTGMQAKVTADYNRFQILFKNFAENDDTESAKRLLDEHRGRLISEQEYLTRLEIDLPRITQSAQARKMIDAGTPGIIQFLEEKDSKGVYQNLPNILPEQRTQLLNYARAKDSKRRADENLLLVDELSSGKVISRKDISEKFRDLDTPEDLRQKHEQLQIVDRFESARKRASTAAKEEHLKRMANADEVRIYNFKFSQNSDTAAQQYEDMRRKLLVSYSSDMAVFDKLMARLDASYKSTRQPTVSYKNSPLFKTGQDILEGFKAQGMYAAGKEGRWWGINEKEDTSAGSVRYIGSVMESDLAGFIQDHPKASAADLKKFLDERISLYNKTTVSDIAEMQFNNAKKGKGEAGVGSRSSLTGTFHGKKVIKKNGKWDYVK